MASIKASHSWVIAWTAENSRKTVSCKGIRSTTIARLNASAVESHAIPALRLATRGGNNDELTGAMVLNPTRRRFGASGITTRAGMPALSYLMPTTCCRHSTTARCLHGTQKSGFFECRPRKRSTVPIGLSHRCEWLGAAGNHLCEKAVGVVAMRHRHKGALTIKRGADFRRMASQGHDT